ncbi:MAG: alginate export family protein, partial [Vicinamibacterales bacterium]
MPRWLRVRGEFRERMEGFDGLGFNSTREDLYWLSRFRFNATATASKQLSFQVQVQDARVAKKTVGPTGTPFKAPFDLRMAFTDVGSTTGPVTVRVGRQELVYGEQRLLGHVSWLNAARTFDAVKLTYRTKAFQVDAFGASLVRILDNELDKSGNGNRFAGAYLTTGKILPKGTVEPY